MATSKEYDGTLFDQLTIIERIEGALEKGGEEAAMEMIREIKKEVNRKLYQKPPVYEELER